MNMSHKWTFSIFSVLLVVAFAFVATPAMAITTVTAQVTEIVANDNTAGSEVQGKKVVTIKYSENADPAPVITGPDNTNTPADDDTDDDVLALTRVDAKTYTLTFLGPADGTAAAVIPTLTLTGYVPLAGLDAHVIDATTPANSTNAVTDFVLNVNTLAGKGYAIIATYYPKEEDGSAGDTAITATVSGTTNIDVSGATNGSFPTLPTNLGVFSTTAPINLDGLVRRSWDDHYGATTTDLMPDLWAHFQQGHRGTLDLTVVQGDTAPIDGTFTTAGTGNENAATRVGDANARTVVINEVMWARDKSQVGGIGELREQWIEIYNTKTTPVPFENIRFTLSNAHPAPTNVSTDRLSTNPSYTNVWDLTGKGEHGKPPAVDGSGGEVFASMHRTNHANGWTAGHWAKAGDLFLPNYQGTPGKANSLPGLPGKRNPPGTDTPDISTFVINEIGNIQMKDKNYDWVELMNKSSAAQPLNNWSLTKITDFNNESLIYNFPNKSIPGGGIVLLVRAKPQDTPFARGFDLNKGLTKAVDGGDQDFGADPNITYLVVGDKLDIPNDNNWLLVLRSNKDTKFYNSGHHLRDVAGPAAIVQEDLNKASPLREKQSNGNAGGDIWQTKLFPMNGRGEAGDKILRHDRNLQSNVWARNTGKQGWARHAFNPAGFTGIGYDRNVPKDAAHGGTPGYPNGAAKGLVADVTDGQLVISELMLTTDNGRYSQWIELTNTSKTLGIHLAADATDPKTGWQIKIENHNSGTWSSNNRRLNVTINLRDWFSYIPPNQSVLIAAFTGSYSQNIPNNRVADVTNSKRGDFNMSGRRDAFLNAEGGFLIQIIDGNGNVADEVGNLDGVAPDARKGIGLDDPVGWNWSTAMSGEVRTSLLRLMNDDGTARAGTPLRAVEDDPETADVDETVEANLIRGAILPIGTKVRGAGKTGEGEMMKHFAKYKDYAWVHAADVGMLDIPTAQKTWFGAAGDKGTPLHTSGKPLPVELSFFRPTLEDGQVTIQWTTESELENAGFNILRSDTRDGEFRQVNEQMIQGKGTTAERSTYKWVDTTAKPGAVYYYQIEDVSFAGEHNTLATTKLKGLISAKGKLTTQWGELKNLR